MSVRGAHARTDGPRDSSGPKRLLTVRMIHEVHAKIEADEIMRVTEHDTTSIIAKKGVK